MEEGTCLVLSLQLILQFYVLFSLGKGISFRILPTKAVYNYKKELGEYFSLPSLLISKLLYYYKILVGITPGNTAIAIQLVLVLDLFMSKAKDRKDHST